MVAEKIGNNSVETIDENGQRALIKLSPWPKGTSGNPSGRPADSVGKLVRMRLVAGDEEGIAYAHKLIDRLIDIGLHSPREDSAIRAIETLFNRGFGLPRQSIEVTSDADDPRLAALQAIAATLRAQAGLSPLAPAADASAIDVPSAPAS